MKAVFITREGYKLSGCRVRCHNFARELAGRGIQTEVFSFADDLGAPFGEEERTMGALRKVALNFSSMRRLGRQPPGTVFIIQRLNYHSFGPWLLSALKGYPLIFDIDDWNIREDPVYYFGFYPSSKAEFLTRRIAAASRACVAASRYLYEYLLPFNPRTEYIPTGVDTGHFLPRPGRESEEVVLSWTGTVYHPEMRDNLFFLLECFRELSSAMPKVRLEICGEGGYMAEVAEKAKSAGLAGLVRMKGWVDPDSISAYLDGVDVGLLPLIQDSRFNNAKSPTKLFEYMAKGVTVVASPTIESCRVVRHGENGFLASDKEEYVGVLRRVCADASLRRAIGARARSDVEKNYSLAACGKKLYEVVKRVAETRITGRELPTKGAPAPEGKS